VQVRASVASVCAAVAPVCASVASVCTPARWSARRRAGLHGGGPVCTDDVVVRRRHWNPSNLPRAGLRGRLPGLHERLPGLHDRRRG